ncbi:hypothetical protein TrVE_jg7658 [Triparma verrucosa]|uniref:5'-3' exonuclease domain-containing protein n=1 Tax=Triparma verrucosa TaxID=1606542 RepID=A0A9W7C191_9STRA|nr:hypothetical protein TrVE_jg7658 [Triparma verrucosa]
MNGINGVNGILRCLRPRLCPKTSPGLLRHLSSSLSSAVPSAGGAGGDGTGGDGYFNVASEFYRKANEGTGSRTYMETLKERQGVLESEIFSIAGGPFNLNSRAQLSKVIHGSGPTQSVSKDSLDAMAGGGNPLAGKVLKYREITSQIKRVEQSENRKAERRIRSSNLASKAAEGENGVTTGRDPLVLIDSSAYIFRSYYAMPPLHRSDGTPTGAVLGFCNMLNKLVMERLLRGERPRLVMVFDCGGKNFRHELYSEYKGNRPPCPVDLIPQFELIKDMASAYGVQRILAEGYEADDVIATLASRGVERGVNVNVVSSDKDLMQLVDDGGEGRGSCVLIDPMKQKRVGVEQVVEKWGVTPDKLGDVLALAGDTADNVPGVKGIGPKIASGLINEYGGLEELLERTDEVKQNKRREALQGSIETARLSRQLVELVRDVPTDKIEGMDNLEVEELRMEELDEDRLLNFYQEMGFRDIRRRMKNMFEGSVNGQPGVGSSVSNYVRKRRGGGGDGDGKEGEGGGGDAQKFDDVPF